MCGGILLMMDQHAADERIRLEKIQAGTVDILYLYALISVC